MMDKHFFKIKRGDKYMDKFQDILMKVGIFAGENRYLSAIKNAFQAFVPFTIIGAVGVLWSNVICNDTTGLGAIVPVVINLSFLNPAFNALNFATIGCISIAITFLVGGEIGKSRNSNPMFCGLLAVISLLTVTQTTMDIETGGELIQSVTGIFSTSLGSQGLFTGMIVAIISVELFCVLFKLDKLKIKLPDQVPPQIAKSFEYLVPAFIGILIIALIGLMTNMLSGVYINDLIFDLIQKPLLTIGGSLPGVLTFMFISLVFWAIGLHGDNMIGGVFNPILTTLAVQNLDAVKAGLEPVNIVNNTFHRAFFATGGTGCMLGLTLAMLIICKRPENKSIARIAFVPELFNIGEVSMFGVPIVLNPTLIIPFILAPLISVIFGYVLTMLNICPILYIDLPWTMPPLLISFLGSGGNIMGPICQLFGILLSAAVYLPFLKIYEKQQAKLDELAN